MYSDHNKFAMISFLVILFLINGVLTEDVSVYKSLSSFRDCLGKKHSGICLKEKALIALDESIRSDKPVSFYGMMDIEKNPDYNISSTQNLKLNDALYEKVEEFFKSRIIKFNIASALETDAEGRAKKGGKGKGNMMMMMMVMGGMACMAAQLMLGKIAFVAGTALILAKVALFMSAIIGLKKAADGGGGGETQHVVYASDYGHSHGGGWHRSLENESTNMAYKTYENNYGY